MCKKNYTKKGCVSWDAGFREYFPQRVRLGSNCDLKREVLQRIRLSLAIENFGVYLGQQSNLLEM
jgi:hypothetical protein